MLHFGTSTAGGIAGARGALRAAGLLTAGLVAAAAAVLATPASAAAIYLDKGEMFTPARETITGPAGSGYAATTAYAGPVLFTANYGTTANTHAEFTFLGFCVDIFDSISPGIDTNATLNLPETEGQLTTNGAHSPYPASDLVVLNQTQKNEIAALVYFGTNLWNADVGSDPTHLHMSNTLIDELAGVQGAIWKIENPTFSIVGASSVNGWGGTNTNHFAANTVTSYITQYTQSTFLNALPSGHIDVISSSTLPLHQSFAFAVPEPDTWALMILGFGGIGAAMRRRRAAAVPA